MNTRRIFRHIIYLVIATAAAAVPSRARAQTPAAADSVPSTPVKHTVPADYGDLMAKPLPADFKDPANIITSVEYDTSTGMYLIRTRLGDLTW